MDCADGESVLDALERHGVPHGASCRTGACQSCLIKVTEGAVPPQAQAGLKDTWKAAGLALACQLRPQAPLQLAEPAGVVGQVQAVVRSKARLSDSVVRLRLRPQGEFSYQPGQFVHLQRGDGLTRAYSLASVGQEALELHVRVVPGGQMSQWIAQTLGEGDEVSLRGPSGECFYVDSNPAEPLVMVAVGTGLAPLWGIAREALRQGHHGSVSLYHAGLDVERLYMADELASFALLHGKGISVHRCVLNGPAPGCRQGDVLDLLKADGHPWKDARVYLCGDPTMVKRLKKQCFLMGASLSRIHADAFEHTPAS